MKKSVFLILSLLLAAGCNNNKLQYDAAGTFEATEILISSEASGVIRQFNIEEGQVVKAGTQVGVIDTTQLYLQKLQLLGTRRSLQVSRPDVDKQITATREEIARLRTEKARIENLIRGDAATGQQLDEVNAHLRMAEGRLSAQINLLQSTVGSLEEQSSTVDIQVAQIEDKLAKCRIVNPVTGTVLKKYAEVHEVSSPARPLYRIADLETVYLRAYITSDHLTKVQSGRQVKVYADYGARERREYGGRIVWISDRAEFTPKTIQTRNERAHLVYAVKIAVPNDGCLKIGMYGEVAFDQ